MSTKLYCADCDIDMTPETPDKVLWVCGICRKKVAKWEDQIPYCMQCNIDMVMIDRKFTVVYERRSTKNGIGSLWECPECQMTVGRLTEFGTTSNIDGEVSRVIVPNHLKKQSDGYGAISNRELFR